MMMERERRSYHWEEVTREAPFAARDGAGARFS